MSGPQQTEMVQSLPPSHSGPGGSRLKPPEGRSSLFDALWELPDRRTVMVLSVIAASVFIMLLTAIFPANSYGAEILIDHSRFSHFPYPFTIQNLEHIIFFIGLGEIFVRRRIAARERRFLDMNLLPEDQQTVLQQRDLGPIRRRVAGMFDHDSGILPSLIDISILQFQSGRSVDQVVSVMNSSLELIEHRVDLRYSLIRYIAWLVPTIGFIGTVVGLGASLAMVPKNGQLSIYAVAHSLSLGFNCTLVALMESAILVFFLHVVQEREESAMNLAGSYTLRNLINRLYEGQQ